MRSLDELKQEIRLLAYIEQQGQYRIKALGGGKYRITPCPVCGYEGDFTLYDDTNSYSSGMSCCRGGSMIDYFMEAEKMTQEDAIRKLRTLAGEDVGDKKKPAATTASTKKPLQYYYNRGLTDKTIQKYGLGYDESGPYGKAYPYKLPVSDSFTVWRAADEKEDPRYKNSGNVDLFNAGLLEDPAVKVIGITEGIFDALSLEEVGLPSIALNSAANKGKLPDLLKGLKDQRVIIALDNDAAGKAAAEDLEEVCRSADVQYRIFKSNYKDPNEYLLKDREGLRWAVRAAYTAGTGEDYLRDSFVDDLEKHYQQKEIKTNFRGLDVNLGGGLYPGLYMLGAMPGIGKTAFALHMADNIAAQGHKVLFFSLEMSRFEMICRSIAREVYQKDRGTDITTGHILRGKTAQGGDMINNSIFNTALDYYRQTIAPHIIIEEGNFGITIANIIAQIRHFAEFNPVVFIDYLQIIRGEDPRATDKQITDYHVTELKRLSRDIDIPIIAISSFNRTNYDVGGFKAFKESGAIEYSADVVWGMKRNEDQAAEEPAKIELEILKNRRGPAGKTIDIQYLPKNNLFFFV